MTSASSFSPDWLSPPGESLVAILDDRRIGRDDAAAALGLDTEKLNDLIRGRVPVTADLAGRLAQDFGATSQFWLRREAAYRARLASRLEMLDNPATNAWLKALPVADMQKANWIPQCDSKAALAHECLRFFGVPSVHAWQEEYSELEGTMSGQFHTSATFGSERESVLTWIREAEHSSASLRCATWNSKAWQELLPSLRPLTREPDPKKFIPELQRRCAHAGVAVVAVRAPSGCRASGAALHIARERRLIVLSFRHLVDDQLWFTFFHEASHLLLHPAKLAIIDSDDDRSEQFELEASKAASELLVPLAYRAQMLRLGRNRWAVARFARSIGVAPGIVVGQLQHMGIWGPERMNHLKRRYRWNGSIPERA